MRPFRPAAALAATALTASVILFGAPPASAAAPPPSWGGARELTCDGETVIAHWTPGGVFTAFVVVGSTDIIVPKRVEALIPPATTPRITRDVRGFHMNAVETVHCTYTDPLGYYIELWGVRT